MPDEPLEAVQDTEVLEAEQPDEETEAKPEAEVGEAPLVGVPPLPEEAETKRTPILVAIVIVILLMPALYFGFFTEEDDDPLPVPEPTPFDFLDPETGEPLTIPATTFYHFDGGIDAIEAVANGTYNLSGDNIPLLANASYYGFGTTTFEPTIGVTSTGSLFMTNYGGTGRGTHIIRSQDKAQTWEDMGPVNQEYSSNDPYVYVDLWTDRVVKFDMHALATMFVEYSDNEGQSWIGPIPASGMYTPQDHQTIASVPPPPDFPHPVLYDTIFVFCINTGAQGPIGSQCDSSFDGGHTWEGQVPGHPTDKTQCSGLTGHLIGADDGSIYRGNPACGSGSYPTDPAAYRSQDGGRTWTEHIITPATGMTAGQHSREVALGTDEGNNVHALWMGDDRMVYYSNSQDQGDTWREPMMVAPPGVTGTGFPTIAGGGDGRVAFSYIGTRGSDGAGMWDGYLGIMTDAFAEHPLITTVAVNAPEDKLDESNDCGYRRCGGFGDFIDIVIDHEGRPWAAMSHNPSGNIGIVGTFWDGPALRGDLGYIETVLPVGGPSTL